VAARRFGNENAETRTDLLNVAEDIMRKDGYAALTSRHLGKEAGLSPQIVYYYFKTMDDLFVALFRRSEDYYLKTIESIKNSAKPIAGLWELSSNPARAVVIQELMALANHRKVLIALFSDFGRIIHAKQTEIIAQEIDAGRFESYGLPPAMIAATLEVAARGFAASASYDIPAHHEARDFILVLLKRNAEKPETELAGS
jgi:AcrR family transcriptional regulator